MSKNIKILFLIKLCLVLALPKLRLFKQCFYLIKQGIKDFEFAFYFVKQNRKQTKTFNQIYLLCFVFLLCKKTKHNFLTL